MDDADVLAVSGRADRGGRRHRRELGNLTKIDIADRVRCMSIHENMAI
jgi:hypothetical protein